MLRKVCPCNGQTVVFHTPYGQLYSRPLPVTDRIMPNVREYMKPFNGMYPSGVYHVVPTPVYVLSNSYGGKFAVADQPTIKRPAPWQRLIK